MIPGIMPVIAGGTGFSPADLPLSAWYDPSDISTLWQDNARTTPVTASGDPVGCIDDKSGNGRHLIQATSGARPIYTVSDGLAYLAFDGSNDALSFTGTNVPVYHAVAGVRITGGSHEAGVFSNRTDSGTMRSGWTRFNANWFGYAGNKFYGRSYNNRILSNAVPSGDAVLSASAGDTYTFTTGFSVANDRGLGRYMQLRLYGLIVTSALLDVDQIADPEDWMAEKAGVVL